MNYPRKIAIEKYPGIWVNYKQQYEFDGGMYYETDEDRDIVTGNFVALTKENKLQFVWNGKHNDWDVKWKVIGDGIS